MATAKKSSAKKRIVKKRTIKKRPVKFAKVTLVNPTQMRRGEVFAETIDEIDAELYNVYLKAAWLDGALYDVQRKLPRLKKFGIVPKSFETKLKATREHAQATSRALVFLSLKRSQGEGSSYARRTKR